ncbi:MAG: dephospho-CoA kinase [Acidobacteriota bacterium]
MNEPGGTASGACLLRVGLTGGIASGKSTVDRMLEELGAHIIDADALVHGLLQQETPERRRVVECFGKEILTAEGQVDRRALASMIFKDPGARAQLSAILHPGVRREESRLHQALRREGGGIAITDAALLVETGRHRAYHRLLVVACESSLQMTRLLARDPHLSRQEARARLAAQAPVEAKRAAADYIIETSGSLGETRRQVLALYAHLVEDLEVLRRGQPLPRRGGKTRES